MMGQLVSVGVQHPAEQLVDVGVGIIGRLLQGITNVGIGLIQRMNGDGEVLRVDHDRWAPVVLIFDEDHITILGLYANGTHRVAFEVDLPTTRLQAWNTHSALRWLRGRLEAINTAHGLCW